jgi:hypothetical protein
MGGRRQWRRVVGWWWRIIGLLAWLGRAPCLLLFFSLPSFPRSPWVLGILVLTVAGFLQQEPAVQREPICRRYSGNGKDEQPQESLGGEQDAPR